MKVVFCWHSSALLRHALTIESQPGLPARALVETFDLSITHEANPDGVPTRVEFGLVGAVAPRIRRHMDERALEVLAVACIAAGISLTSCAPLFSFDAPRAERPLTWPELIGAVEVAHA